MHFFFFFLLVTETINFWSLPQKLWICYLVKATTNGDWGTRTGDLSDQSPRLYHCASPLQCRLHGSDQWQWLQWVFFCFKVTYTGWLQWNVIYRLAPIIFGSNAPVIWYPAWSTWGLELEADCLVVWGKPRQFSKFSREILCETTASWKVTVKPLIPTTAETLLFFFKKNFLSRVTSGIRTCLAEVSS